MLIGLSERVLTRVVWAALDCLACALNVIHVATAVNFLVALQPTLGCPGLHWGGNSPPSTPLNTPKSPQSHQSTPLVALRAPLDGVHALAHLSQQLGLVQHHPGDLERPQLGDDAGPATRRLPRRFFARQVARAPSTRSIARAQYPRDGPCRCPGRAGHHGRARSSASRASAQPRRRPPSTSACCGGQRPPLEPAARARTRD